MLTSKRAKILFVGAIAVIIISAGAYMALKPAVQLPKSIKIGWPTPITGAIASFSEADLWIADYIERIVNEGQGGVYLSEYGQKIPIEILIRNTESDSDIAASVAEELILKDKVDMILALHTPGMTVPVSAVCEKYKTPCIVSNTPILSWLTGAPYEWSYAHFWTEPDVAEVYVRMWDLLETNKRTGGLWNDDGDGKTFREATIAVAREHGYDVAGDEGLVSYDTEDFSPYIASWIEKDVELFTGNFIPPNFTALWKQINDMGFSPKAATIGRAILFPAAVAELGGDLPLGLTTEVWASIYHPGESAQFGLTAEKLAGLWEEESGKQWTQPLFYSFGMLEVAVDVLTRVGSLDKKKVKDALADTDLDTIVGWVSYKAPLSNEDKKRYEKWPQLIENKSHYSLAPVVGGQWARGEEWPWDIQIVDNWKYDAIPQTAEIIPLP